MHVECAGNGGDRFPAVDEIKDKFLLIGPELGGAAKHHAAGLCRLPSFLRASEDQARSNSAMPPKTVRIIFPEGLVVSAQGSSRD